MRALLLVAACLICVVLAAKPISVDSVTRRLIDGDNREVTFHGLNVVVKGDPWIPDFHDDHWSPLTSFNTKDLKKLQQLGINAIRLGVMWPAVEPVRGQYNEAYLKDMYDLVVNASHFGISVLLDMHQDLLSEKFCGEGVPMWAAQPNVSTFPIPLDNMYKQDPNGVPLPGQCEKHEWPMYYIAEATGSAFEAIFTNKNGLLDSFIGFWKKVATTMAPLKDVILGYNLMNEPFPGDVVADPKLFIPGYGDKEVLQGVWDKVATAIRQVDPDHAIFFEATTFSDLGVGFTDVPGGKEWRTKSVLSYHQYVPPNLPVEVQMGIRMKDMGEAVVRWYAHGIRA